MIKSLFCIMGLLLSGLVFWYSYTEVQGNLQLGGIFLSGFLLGLSLMIIKLYVKNDKINSYKRELEKESLTSTESSSKVKVLESKIEVLEKALENALNNK